MKNNSSTAKQDVGMNDETVIISIIVNNKKKKPTPHLKNRTHLEPATTKPHANGHVLINTV